MVSGTNSEMQNMRLKVKELEVDGDDITSAASIAVAAGTDGLSAADLQTALQALATRVQALEDA